MKISHIETFCYCREGHMYLIYIINESHYRNVKLEKELRPDNVLCQPKCHPKTLDSILNIPKHKSLKAIMLEMRLALQS